MKLLQKSGYKLCLTALICTILWGSAIPCIKLGYSLFSIMTDAIADKLVFAGIRFTGAGMLILIPFFFFRRKLAITKDLMAQACVIGLVQTAAQYFFMYIGLAYTTGVNASVFNAAGTLLYVVLVWLIYRDEAFSKIKLIGCICGFLGIIINCLATQRMGILSLKGDGFVILANVCVAVGFLYSKHSVKCSDPFLLTGVQMSFGGLVLLAGGVLLGGTLPAVTVGGLGILFYLILVSSVTFSLWTRLLRDYPAALVGMFNFFTPIFGTIFSYILSKWQLLGEDSTFTIHTIFAIICSTGGVFLASLGNVAQEKTQKVHSVDRDQQA